jgi:hypothetical protein
LSIPSQHDALQAHAPLSLVQVPTVLFFRRRVRVRARGKYLDRRLHDVDGGAALVSLAFLFRLLFVKKTSLRVRITKRAFA